MKFVASEPRWAGAEMEQHLNTCTHTFAYFFPFLYSVLPSEQGKSPLSVIIPILSPWLELHLLESVFFDMDLLLVKGR